MEQYRIYFPLLPPPSPLPNGPAGYDSETSVATGNFFSVLVLCVVLLQIMMCCAYGSQPIPKPELLHQNKNSKGQ